MLLDNAERDICLSKHYFNPGDTRNDRYLSFIPSKHSIAWQTRNLFFVFVSVFVFLVYIKNWGIQSALSFRVTGHRLFPQSSFY